MGKLAQLRAMGFTVELNSGRKFDVMPAEKLTPELIERIRVNREILLAELLEEWDRETNALLPLIAFPPDELVHPDYPKWLRDNGLK